MDIRENKQQFRKKIILLKRKYPAKYITQHSDKIIKYLEENKLFQQATKIALYHALPGEVQTAGLLEKWYKKKQLLLPVVKGANLSLQLYAGKDKLQMGCLGIFEPVSETEDQINPELIVIPGIAFDRQLNRLGRGKGYYDRLLSNVTVPCIGVCFHFQLFDQIPADAHDRKMSVIITDREIIT
ncbi:MAG: 5-formyltetrahydrofolate cyclo-ligase [Tannerella sp.]|jgi:5-formyltetrahydrofolate cyclo-ligase|nr:5-formyltetrahydrofolate cyclo-ligase [Tannerella sp.]